MTHFKTFMTMTSTAALFAGSAAMADVTALQVWEDWKENLEIYGSDAVTIGSEDVLGGTVTIKDVAIDFSDDTTSIATDIGDIIFTEQGDGTVNITMANEIPLSIKPKTGGGGAELMLTNTGLVIVASGEPGAMNFAVKADQYALRMSELVDETGAVMDGDIYVAANNMSGEYVTSGDDLRTIDYDLTLGSVDLLIDIKEPGGDNAIVMSGKMNEMSGNASIAMPDGIDMSDPETFMMDGFATTANYTYGQSNYIFDFSADGSQAAGSATVGSGSLDVDFSAQGVAYETMARDVAVNLQSADFPFPISMSFAEYGIGLQIPLAKSEALSDFGFSINLTDWAINEEIWMMGDPTGALSHEPATIKLDLSGKVKLLADLMDPEAAEAMAFGGSPGELHEVSLNDLQLKIAGALLTGTGGFTFDNAAQSMIPGLPQPEGEVTLNLTGANKLIDSLVAMGLLPEDQAMMGRMMMGMFARTVGDDQLTSTLEINDQGHILANGQRIQ